MNKISGTIITLNNEHLITECILSLKKVCDEIIVVDSLSSDNTVSIARDLGAKIYLQEFLGDGPQKKLAASYATNDWVFSLDADERIEQDLIEYVNTLTLESSDYMSYSFKILKTSFLLKKFVIFSSPFKEKLFICDLFILIKIF